MQWVLTRLFVVTQGEHFLVSCSIAAVVELLLHRRPLPVRNVESITSAIQLTLFYGIFFVCNFFP